MSPPFVGSMLVSSSYDETLVIWDVENCCQKFALKVKILSFYDSYFVLDPLAFQCFAT